MEGEAYSLQLVALISLQLLYRKLLHPLHTVPGPFFNCVSELPATFALIRGEQHIYYQKLHDRYGAVVRVSPNELSFISAKARQGIYCPRKGHLSMEKSPIFLGAVGSVDGETGVSLALGAEHTRQRRALGVLFTNRALLQHEHTIQHHISKLLAALREEAAKNRAVECSSWYTYIAFDIMGDLCFAEPFGCLDQASATEWSTSVINVFVAATWTQAIRRLSGVGTWSEKLLTKILVPTQAAQWRNIHLANSRSKTTRRLDNGSKNYPDFIQQILDTESKSTLSRGEIILNMALFISAGTDTTATALTGWTYFVCSHQKVMDRVVREIRGSLKTSDEIKWEKVQNLKYLEASVQESLRLFPPSAASQQRIVPFGGATIDSTSVPAGTTVAAPPWASTRSCLNFEDPESFRPERWLENKNGFRCDKLSASLPFGAGPRTCIGQNLAIMEIRLILSHLLWNFDISLDVQTGGDANKLWGEAGHLRPPKVFHSLTKLPLIMKLKKSMNSRI